MTGRRAASKASGCAGSTPRSAARCSVWPGSRPQRSDPAARSVIDPQAQVAAVGAPAPAALGRHEHLVGLERSPLELPRRHRDVQRRSRRQRLVEDDAVAGPDDEPRAAREILPRRFALEVQRRRGPRAARSAARLARSATASARPVRGLNSCSCQPSPKPKSGRARRGVELLDARPATGGARRPTAA